MPRNKFNKAEQEINYAIHISLYMSTGHEVDQGTQQRCAAVLKQGIQNGYEVEILKISLARFEPRQPLPIPTQLTVETRIADPFEMRVSQQRRPTGKVPHRPLSQ